MRFLEFFLQNMQSECPHFMFEVQTFQGRRSFDKPAQSTALGLEFGDESALKGRDNAFVPPFQGSMLVPGRTQGVALGWLVEGLWPTEHPSEKPGKF
jgi:hypothetical protein